MTKVALTYRDYTALPDDGKRYELYDGELVEATSPTLRHQRAVRHLMESLTGTSAPTTSVRSSRRHST